MRCDEEDFTIFFPESYHHLSYLTGIACPRCANEVTSNPIIKHLFCPPIDTPGQGEFVLVRKFQSVKDLRSVLDIQSPMMYNRYRLHDAG